MTEVKFCAGASWDAQCWTKRLPAVQDVVITNQVRILNCLEALEDLRANPQVSQVVLRRVREFEEEFIEKAVAQAEGAVEEETREAISIVVRITLEKA